MASSEAGCLINDDKIIVFPSTSNDFNSARCRLHVSRMKMNGLRVNDAVCISFKRWKIYCRVWPSMGATFAPKNFIQIDSCVSRNIDEDDVDVENLRGCLINSWKDITPLQTTVAKVVEVTVFWKVFPNISPRLIFDKSRRAAQVRCILRDKVFVKYCWISIKKLLHLAPKFIEDVDKVFINDVDPEMETKALSTGFLLSKDTKIIVKNMRSLESVAIKNNICLAVYGDLVKHLDDLVNMSFDGIMKKARHGFLFIGPPGVGKSSLVYYLACRWEANLFVINGSDIFAACFGESEANLKAIFDSASETSKHTQCVLFLDELDVLCSKRSEGNNMENRVSSLLLSLIDDLPSNVTLIAATNRPNVIDPAIRRPGRFDKELVIGTPSCYERLEILRFQTRKLPLFSCVNLDVLAKHSLGYVSADLMALVRLAVMNASMTTTTDGDWGIKMWDFEKSFKDIVPSTYRGVDAIVENISTQWTDIAGYTSVKQVLKQTVEWPFLYPDAFSRLGLSRPRGILLYGPPGCSKTSLVRAAATCCCCTFLSLSCAQLYSPYVGDAEKMLREVFKKARAASPSILFLDEVDAIVRKRSLDSGHGVEARILSTLLNEIDGIGVSTGVYESSSGNVPKSSSNKDKNILFVAATNRPEVLDEAILRPGRIDRVVYVPQPGREIRVEILQLHCGNMPTCDDVDLSIIAENTEYFSGADLKNLCREAALIAMEEFGVDHCRHVNQSHFLQALSITMPSLSKEQIRNYEQMSF